MPALIIAIIVLVGIGLRSLKHKKQTQNGLSLIARRLGQAVPQLQAYAQYPAFSCLYCGTPNPQGRLLLGCGQCGDPMLPSDLGRNEKDGTVTCPDCQTTQALESMPFCCGVCRRIQTPPANPNWRRDYASVKIDPTALAALLFGVPGLLLLLVGGGISLQTTSPPNVAVFVAFTGLFTGITGGIVALALLFRKPSAAAVLMTSNGVGFRDKEGRENWVPWEQVIAIEAISPPLNMYSGTTHPDSTATRWMVRTMAGEFGFDPRIVHCRDVAQQIRLRAPRVPLEDLPFLTRTDPVLLTYVTAGIVWLILLSIGIVIAVYQPS